MKELFDKYSISVDNNKLFLFEEYYKLLLYYNEKFNITAITDKKEVYLKHFIDSLLCIDKLSGDNFLDIGSGGGFPAVPIKILKPEISMTMIEATGKKCEFLKAIISELGLKNAFVINGRCEDLAKNLTYREKFDTVTSRAVAKLNTLSEYCLPFVKEGGYFVAFKGDALEELKSSQNAIKILGGKCEYVDNLILEDAKRDIVFIKKISKTPEKYPRGNGKERKNPL